MPAARSVLQLPRDRAQLRVANGENAAAQRFECVEVQAFTESFGRIEDAVRDLAARLDDGGTLLLDVDNLQSPRMLRLVVEGRPGAFEPAGSTDDPSQVLPLRRVLNAFVAAGLSIRDVLRVPACAPEFVGGQFASSLTSHGFLPLDWLDAPPPARFWIVAQKARCLAGSVVVAGGDDAARERTANVVRRFLPNDWEVVVADAVRETAQWNRGIAAARGDVVWLLRGGTVPSRETFEALAVSALVRGTAVGREGERQHQGDVAGIMLPRQDLLFVGPMPERIANTAIALEEYAMRLDSRLPAPQIVEAGLDVPRPIVEEPNVFAAEARELMNRWSPIGDTAAAPKPPQQDAPQAAPAPWAGRSPRVSLCMIAKNEQRFLATCLEHVREAVDEIIVVDTGSTDDTVAIAKSFGAKVLFSPWNDDFSHPRNVALGAATGDWILVLDADEFVKPGGCERIRELVTNERVSGYHLHFVNVYGKGKTLGVMMVRLFRNLPGVRYEGIIHEQVTPSLQRFGLEAGLVLASADVVVDHHGYTDEVMDQRGKNERNERLFVKQLAAAPDDIYAHYKYGDFLRRVPGRGVDARRLLDRCLELILAGPPSLPRELPYASEVAALCALEAARAGDNGRARAVLDTGLRRFVPTPNLHYLAASLALSEGRAEDAMLHYRRCLSYHGQVLVVPIQEGITSYVSFAGIAQAWLLRGDRERAQRLLEKAIAMEPAYEVAHLALSRLLLERGDIGDALAVLTKFLASHPDSPGACQQTTLILQRLGKTNEARRMGRHAVQLLQARALDHEAEAMNKILATL